MTVPFLGYRILRVTVAFLGLGFAKWEQLFPKLWPAKWKRWQLPERFGLSPSTSSLHPHSSQEPTLWVHAASLGEAAGLIQILRHLPLLQNCLVTAQTLAGLNRLLAFAENWKTENSNSKFHLSAALAPFESPIVVRQFLVRHQITKVILYESETWPAYIETAHQLSIPIFWIAARWGKKTQQWTSRFPKSTRHILKPLTSIQARSQEDANCMRNFFSGPILIGCDAKGLHVSRNESIPNGSIPKTRNGIALYCIHREEWPFLKPHLQTWMALAPVKILPRYPEDFSFFQKELSGLGFTSHQGNLAAKGTASHVLVDVLGCSSTYLRDCHLAFVGGSLDQTGGHAFWEPLQLGLRLVSGPDLQNQAPLAASLQSAQLLQVIAHKNSQGWADSMNPLTEDEQENHALRISTFLKELSKGQNQALQDLRAIFSPS